MACQLEYLPCWKSQDLWDTETHIPLCQALDTPHSQSPRQHPQHSSRHPYETCQAQTECTHLHPISSSIAPCGYLHIKKKKGKYLLLGFQFFRSSCLSTYVCNSESVSGRQISAEDVTLLHCVELFEIAVGKFLNLCCNT